MDYREKPVRFGTSGTMLGILTEPAAGKPANGKGLVLLNAGLLHRVGPSRLHVQVARRMAASGYVSLRFDFSGIGDSDARRDGLAFEQSAALEVQDAINHLVQAKQVRDVTLFGLCSGADGAFLTAVADERVNRLVQLDPWIYHTPRYAPMALWRKMQNRRSWKNLLTGDTFKRRVLPLLRRSSAAATDDENVVVAHYSREFPPKAQVEAQMKGLVDRGVRMFCMFSGGMPESVSYEGQYRECFGSLDFGDLLTVRYEPTAEHIFSALHHQRMVVDETERWLLGSTTAAPVTAGSLVPA